MKDKSNENLIEGFAIADRNMAIERGDYKAELIRRLATRDAVIRELVGALEPFVKDFKYEELDYGSYCSHCGSVDDVMEYSYHKKTCPLRIADQALTRARALLAGQGEPKRGVLRFKQLHPDDDRYHLIDSSGEVVLLQGRKALMHSIMFIKLRATEFAKSLGLEAEFVEEACDGDSAKENTES